MKKLLPMGKLLVISSVFIVTLLFLLQQAVQARVTPNDQYQQRRANFEAQLQKIPDPAKVEKVRNADQLLDQINQKVCLRFEEDVNKLAAIMDELKARKGITETRVAYGGVDTPIESADYWVNYAAEAVAYQNIQDYTPQISSEKNLSSSLSVSMNRLRGDLGILRGKILRAKTEVKKALNSD